MSLSRARSSERGVGIPHACQTSFACHLSMASALASTPDPGERFDSALLRVEGVGIDAFRFQRSEDSLPAPERHRTLRGTPAHEHGYLAEVARAHAASPTILTSGTRSTA